VRPAPYSGTAAARRTGRQADRTSARWHAAWKERTQEGDIMTKSGMAFLVLSLAQTGVAVGCAHRHERVGVNERQWRQRGNIQEGVEEGDLTRKEARRLRERSRDIAEDRRDARSDDGYIDGRERRHIRRERRELGEDIYDQRHDDDWRR
jgi:hypothetical protein